MTQIAKSLCNNLKNDGHCVNEIDLGRGILPLPSLYFKYLKSFWDCDIIHIISASGNALWLKDLPAIIISRLYGKKVVLNFVGGKALKNFNNWPWLKKLPFKLTNAIVVPTNIFKKLIEEDSMSSSIFTIPHVVDIDKFYSPIHLKKNNHVLIASKSFEKYSGYDFLIDVFKEIKKDFPAAQFWILGDGPEKNKIIEDIKKSKVCDVKLYGNLPHNEVPEYYSRSSIFLHASKYESFGLALVEAMASSLPIVSFNIGGIPEVVMDKKTGYLVDYRDMDKFIEVTKKLITDDLHRREMGSYGKKHSKKYHWINIKKQWYRLYKNLVDNKNKQIN